MGVIVIDNNNYNWLRVVNDNYSHCKRCIIEYIESHIIVIEGNISESIKIATVVPDLKHGKR